MLCGYSDPLVCADFQFGSDRTAPLAAFAHEPTDARSACIAIIVVTTVEGDLRSEVAAYRRLGAPIVVALRPKSLEFWKQREGDAELVAEIPANKADAYFRLHASELGPDAVFRAKTWGRLDRQFQLSFVDAGLMPLVEREMGQRLTDLIGRVYQKLQRLIWPKKAEVSLEEGHWLIKASFWLLAAKILRDKRVRNFTTLDFTQIDDVFGRVARHYDSSSAELPGLEIRSQKQRRALESAAQDIADFSHLGHVTTESLSHVYESALITPQVRKALGTHSTPQYLVDYVVWKLRPWIEEIPESDRHVFEPACGHAAFLVAAVRLLKELLEDKQIDRKKYLRGHLHGLEIDSFAIEIARLSLTLADIPNPNGWDLTCDDMFTKSLLGKKAAAATILLGNPPFENFKKNDRVTYESRGWPISYINKTAEVLGQTLPQLPVGGVFGFVVPQGFLHSSNARDIRALICRDFEIQEICLFPDKVFSFSDAESAVILGRRASSSDARCSVSYRRVREADMPRFETDYVVSSKSSVPHAALCSDASISLRLPDLHEIWGALASFPKLESLAHIGQGLFFVGRSKLASKELTTAPTRFRGAVEGFATFGDEVMIHGLPQRTWMNLDPTVIDREVTGATTGVPQVLLNYAPASRGPWRLKSLIDARGHPVTSRFITVRSNTSSVPLEYLWAILNSPLANAYAFSYLGKRDVLVGAMRKMPIPFASEHDMVRIAAQAQTYLTHAKKLLSKTSNGFEDPLARRSLLKVDAEVLRLYDLPPRLERQLLDLFARHQRTGVPFRFDRFYPEGFEPWLHLHEFLSEEFRNTQASMLLESHKSFAQPEVSEALRRATEDFGE